MASRYLATVRRAMSMPASFSFSTIVSSERTSDWALGIDELLDAMTHGFGGMRLAAIGCRNRRREEIFQFEHAAAGRHVFVGRDARDRRLVHADHIGDGLQIERLEILHAMQQERVLLTDDFARHLENCLGALIECAHQPVRRLQAIREKGLVAAGFRDLRHFGVIGLADKDFRQRVGIEFDDPVAVGALLHEYVRHNRLHQRRAEQPIPASDRARGFR